MYEHDDQGRIVASRPEPEWDDIEVGWMLALQDWRDSLCPCGCGWPADVAQDPMTEFRVRVEDPTRCHVRSALAKAQREYASGEGSRPEGLLWRAVMPD